MKVIDLLNKIAKGKIPKTIVYDEKYFTYDEKRQNYFSYDDREIDWKYTVMEYINDKVEIIEEDNKDNFTGWKMHQDGKEVCSIAYSTNEEKKIPEKIKDKYCSQISKVELAQKCNEVIDYLDYLKSKGE